mgnify:CR=1 FL=1
MGQDGFTHSSRAAMIVAFSVGQVCTLLRSSFHLTLFRFEYHSVGIPWVRILIRPFLPVLNTHLAVAIAHLEIGFRDLSYSTTSLAFSLERLRHSVARIPTLYFQPSIGLSISLA